MTPADLAAGPGAGGSSHVGTDLTEHLLAFLSTPSPHVLLVTGSAGSGKTSLLATLRRRLDGPCIVVRYRGDRPEPGAALSSKEAGSGVTLRFQESEGSPPGNGPQLESMPAVSASASPVSTTPDSPGTRPLLDAIGRLSARGNGHIFVDEWDRSTEGTMGGGIPSGSSGGLVASSSWLQDLLGKVPVHAIVALIVEPDSSLQRLADGIVDLGREEQEGCRLRVASLPKMNWKPLSESQFSFTLQGGQFLCPPRLPAGFRVPLGPPVPDPSPQEGSQWPGSEAFAAAFGRFRDGTLTGVELTPTLSHRLMDVIALPAAAHSLRSGGRVLWLPAPQSPPSSVCNEMARLVPPEWLRERFRILSGSGPDPSVDGLKEVILSPHAPSAVGRERQPETAGSAAPLFPEAYRFLRQSVTNAPSLFVLSLDGLSALAAVRGVSYHPVIFPLVLTAYLRLPRFHGLGFGRSDDPLTQAALPSLEGHLKLQQRCGRTVIFGVRPETPGYMLDWAEADGRYSLVPMV